MKVAVRVRPMNKRGKPVGKGVSAEWSARTWAVVWVRVGVLVLWTCRVSQHTPTHTHTTHTSRIDVSIDVRTCVLCVYVL